MHKTKSFFLLFLKGLVVGFGALIPGVSGGTAAMLVGVFEDLIESTANIFKNFKNSLLILLPVFTGALLSIYFISKPIELFCDHFPVISKYIFASVSLVSAVFFIIKTLKGRLKFKHTIYIISGVVISILITILIRYFNILLTYDSYLYLFIIGFPLSFALVLPAISFSYMLYFFGLYEKTLNAINLLKIEFLLPLALGIITGTFIFSRLLNRLIKKYSVETYSFVLGFIICSVINIFI